MIIDFQISETGSFVIFNFCRKLSRNLLSWHGLCGRKFLFIKFAKNGKPPTCLKVQEYLLDMTPEKLMT